VYPEITSLDGYTDDLEPLDVNRFDAGTVHLHYRTP